MIRIQGFALFFFDDLFQTLRLVTPPWLAFVENWTFAHGRSARYDSDTARDGIVMLQGSRRSLFRFLEYNSQRLDGFGKTKGHLRLRRRGRALCIEMIDLG